LFSLCHQFAAQKMLRHPRTANVVGAEKDRRRGSMPADGIGAATTKEDFGTFRWQLSNKTTPVASVRGREARCLFLALRGRVLRCTNPAGIEGIAAAPLGRSYGSG